MATLCLPFADVFPDVDEAHVALSSGRLCAWVRSARAGAGKRVFTLKLMFR